MYVLMIVLLGSVLLGAAGLLGKPVSSLEASQPPGFSAPALYRQAETLARAIEIYHAAAMEWARSNPTFSGTVPHPPAALPASLASSFVDQVRSAIVGGHLATWATGAPAGITGSMLEAALQRNHAFANGAGIVASSSVTSTRDSITWIVTVPAPAGAAVRINRL